MEIEHNEEIFEKQVSERLAILTVCLSANEVVESKQIEVFLRCIRTSARADSKEGPGRNLDCRTEIFLTNFRILLVLYLNGGHFEEKSILFSWSDFKIYTLSSMPNTSFINYVGDDSLRQQILVDKLSNQDENTIRDFFFKKKALPITEQPEDIIRKKILEKDSRLKALFELIVSNKKILSEAQFWQNHDAYQKFLKYKHRDEIKVKRDYIQNEVPLIEKRMINDISVEALDEKETRFDAFCQQIYDPNSLIESQNLKSFLHYKQEMDIYGHIDSLAEKLEKQREERKKMAGARKNEGDVWIIEEGNHQHLVIEEVNLSLNEKKGSSLNQQNEMRKEEFLIQIQQNPSVEQQERLKDFISQARKNSSVLASKEMLKNFKEINKEETKKKTQYCWKEAASYLYKLKSTESPTTDDNRKYYEEYSNKFYQLREILRWIYKEKNTGDKARQDIIEKLKTELEQCRNHLTEIASGIKGDSRIQELQEDLKNSFIFR